MNTIEEIIRKRKECERKVYYFAKKLKIDLKENWKEYFKLKSKKDEKERTN